MAARSAQNTLPTPRLDLLVRMADTGRLVNVEFQTTNEEWLLERLGIYYLVSRIQSKGEHVTPTMRFQIRILDIGDVDGEYLAATGDLGDGAGAGSGPTSDDFGRRLTESLNWRARNVSRRSSN